MMEEMDIDPVEVFQEFLDSRLENVHTCIPGQIEQYDALTRKASVKPLIKLKTRDNEDLDMPVIDNVPVQFPGSKQFTINYPLEKGDTCIMLFAETGIGTWLTGAGIAANADDMSRFSLTDAICIPSLYTFTSVPMPVTLIEFTTAGLEIKNDKADVLLKPTGEINVLNDSGSFNIKSDGVIEINGNADFAVAFTDLKTAFDQLKTDFNTFVTTIYNLHVHPGVTAGPASTGVAPLVGTGSTADMSGAKVDTVKIP